MDKNATAVQKDYFSNKKTVLQFILALLVFFIHFRVFSTIASIGGYVSSILNVIYSVTYIAVPLFFIISAALFYRNYTLDSTLKKWKNRFFSLCIPYLVWNTVWLIVALLGYYTPLGNLLGGVKTAFSVKAVLGGIFLHQFFTPFWFILQLITLTLLCPIIYLLLKNKIVGLVTIAVCFILNFLGWSVEGILIENPDMVIIYLIGAYIGMHHFEWIMKKHNKKQALIALLVFIICCVFQGTKHILSQYIPISQLSLLTTVIGSFAFYITFDLFDITSCPRFMNESFLIYALHSFIGAAIAKILDILLPSGHISAFITVIFSFVTTVFIICIIGNLLGKYAPRIKKWIAGR